MDKNLALKIYNNFDKQDIDLLMDYADSQISIMHSYLEKAETIELVRKYQGIIAGMNKLKMMREDAVNILKQEGKT